MAGRTSITQAEWLAEATRRFGPNSDNWRFVCPACGHVASVADYRAAGAPEGVVAFSCVGRWAGVKRDALGLTPKYDGLPAEGPGPCNYAGGGLFRLHPVEVTFPDGGEPRLTFAFADPV